MSSRSGKITLYHYTTEEGLDGIDKKRVIYQSKISRTTDDARYGNGVYFTSLSPSNGMLELALNNYDDNHSLASRMMKKGKVSRYIAVDLDLDTVQRVKSERDIYLYSGDLHITNDMNYRTGTVTKR